MAAPTPTTPAPAAAALPAGTPLDRVLADMPEWTDDNRAQVLFSRFPSKEHKRKVRAAGVPRSRCAARRLTTGWMRPWRGYRGPRQLFDVNLAAWRRILLVATDRGLVGPHCLSLDAARLKPALRRGQLQPLGMETVVVRWRCEQGGKPHAGLGHSRPDVVRRPLPGSQTELVADGTLVEDRAYRQSIGAAPRPGVVDYLWSVGSAALGYAWGVVSPTKARSAAASGPAGHYVVVPLLADLAAAVSDHVAQVADDDALLMSGGRFRQLLQDVRPRTATRRRRHRAQGPLTRHSPRCWPAPGI